MFRCYHLLNALWLLAATSLLAAETFEGTRTRANAAKALKPGQA